MLWACSQTGVSFSRSPGRHDTASSGSSDFVHVRNAVPKEAFRSSAIAANNLLTRLGQATRRRGNREQKVVE